MLRAGRHQRWADKLLDLPESGMGYQRLRVRLRNGRTVENVIALNAQVLEVPDDEPKFIVAVDLESRGTLAPTHVCH